IVPLLSSFSGYFQGMQYMTPTALSQITEQVGKFFLGLFLAYLYAPKGAEYGAAAAVAGVTMSEGAALALLMGMYRGKRREIAQNIRRSQRSLHIESDRSIFMRIIRIAFPITIGASIMPLVSLADVMIVVNRLRQIGFGKEEATKLYGLLTGSASPLINFPAVLTVALAMSLVPAVTESFTSKDFAGVRHKVSAGIRLTMLFGLPAAAGMAILARPICQLLYSSLEVKYINITGDLLAVLSVGVLFLTSVQTLTAILQGLNRITVPVKNLAIGAVFKILLTYILVGIPGLNVKGAAIGSVVCYGIAALLDMAAVIRYSKARIPVMDFFVKPVAATAMMGVCVFF
ncbi:MAG TPA: polysaccharide biosynthesis protein, partial [Candidatus Atribacteria bacterium]|nr:polysaccharide biosynthesis protein [Candidatus Atribacteria bacterium]